MRAFHWRARPTPIFFFFFLEGRALKKLLINYSTGTRGTRGHVGESPGNTGRACPRRRVPERGPPSNQRSDERWRFMLSLQWPVLNVGQGLDLNNVAEFISTFRRNPLRVFTCCDGTAGRFSSAGSCTRSDHPQAKNNEVWERLPAVERLKVLFKGAISKI